MLRWFALAWLIALPTELPEPLRAEPAALPESPKLISEQPLTPPQDLQQLEKNRVITKKERDGLETGTLTVPVDLRPVAAPKFEAACRDLNVVQSGSEADGYRPDVQISCATMSQLLLRLGFVSRSLSQEEQLDLAEIWRRIGGDGEGQGTVALGNLKNMLRAI